MPAQGAPPTLLPLKSIGLPGREPSALAWEGRRLYLGFPAGRDVRRRNLWVTPVGPSGIPEGAARRFPDSAAPLKPGLGSTVTRVLVDAPRRRLYVAVRMNGTDGAAERRLLTIYALTEAGDPTGTPTSLELPEARGSVEALALHPKGKMLYLAGWGAERVWMQPLNAAGDPEGPVESVRVGGQGKYALEVDPAGRRLYAGSYPDLLEVLPLGPDGGPAGPAVSVTAGANPDYLRFTLAREGLLLQRASGFALWPVGSDGRPQGSPRAAGLERATSVAAQPALSGCVVASDRVRRDLFEDRRAPAAAGGALLRLREGAGDLDAVERLGERPVLAALSRQGAGLVLTARRDPLPRLNLAKGETIRVTLLEAAPRAGAVPPGGFPVRLKLGSHAVSLGSLRIGNPSAWIPMDPALKDKSGLELSRVEVGETHDGTTAGILTRLRLRLEIANEDRARERPIILEDAVSGSTVAFLVPGYAWMDGDRRVRFETLTARAQRYLAAARAVAIPSAERPRATVVSCYHLIGAQGSEAQLRASAEAMGALGFNTANAYWWDGIAPATVDAILDGSGLQRRAQAVYAPPHYFDHRLAQPALDKWVAELAGQPARTHGGSASDVVDLKVADEPGWYFPGEVRDLLNSPAALAAFQAFLKGRARTPAEFGVREWSDVRPLAGAPTSDWPLVERKRFYWTVRFLAVDASRGLSRVREALDRSFPHRPVVAVNWNNWGSRWYVPSPGQALANNPDKGADAGMAGFDWFESGRTGAHTLWSEDWLPDTMSQHTSFAADLLRSASSPGGRGFGAYIVGVTLGDHPAGAAYKLFSLIGHGARSVDFYSWGPATVSPAGCWSERLDVYPAIADALRLLGRAERLTAPGKPARGRVALVQPGSSFLWDRRPESPLYHHELWALHYALVHSGYTVDFVDEVDLAAGALASRGYTTLYLTTPNLSEAAVRAVGAWVKNGGVLAATPGAGVADEYDSPADQLRDVLGIGPRKAVRTAMGSEAEPGVDGVRFEPSMSALGSKELQVSGPIAALDPVPGTEVLARGRDGGAVWTRRSVGRGHAMAFGFFPGWQYWLSPDRGDGSRLPLEWSDTWRRVIAEAPRAANTGRPAAASIPGVETCVLDSPKGRAIVLLNWTDVLQPEVKVRVTGAATGFAAPTSTSGTAVKSRAIGTDLEISLSLRNVDVLLLNRGPQAVSRAAKPQAGRTSRRSPAPDR